VTRTTKPKDWTPARKKAFIVSVLRSGTRRWPPKYETLNEAKTEKKINPATKRLAQHYKCRKCRKDFPAKMVQVDHIKPVVTPSDGFVDWNTFVERLFCDKDNLQVLCVSCHDKKTQKEKKEK
jgi:5-methylcytosine-specific restriction endonuclease McrA